MNIHIKQVESKKDLNNFLKFPYELYKEYPEWVPPIFMDEKETHNPRKNPAFELAKAEYWLAYKDGRIVGRIAGIVIDAEAKEVQLARFGWIDFIDDEEVARQLLHTVETWAKNQGLKGIHGPMGFCDMDPNGMLVEGFDSMATMATTYHPEYTHKIILNLGYKPNAEWVEFRGNASFEFGEDDYKRTEFVKERFGLTIFQPKNRKVYAEYGQQIFELINRTYSQLYGFYPLSKKQITHYVEKYLKFVRTEYACMVLAKGKLVGFGIGMPSFSNALKKINGRLFPFGWIELLKAYKSNEEIDLYLIAADPEYARLGVARLLFFEILKNLKTNGSRYINTNPILQNNKGAKGMWQSPLATEKDIYIRKKRQVFIKRFDDE